MVLEGAVDKLNYSWPDCRRSRGDLSFYLAERLFLYEVCSVERETSEDRQELMLPPAIKATGELRVPLSVPHERQTRGSWTGGSVLTGTLLVFNE